MPARNAAPSGGGWSPTRRARAAPGTQAQAPAPWRCAAPGMATICTRPNCAPPTRPSRSSRRAARRPMVGARCCRPSRPLLGLVVSHVM